MTDALLLLGVIISQYFPFEVDELSASVKQSEDLGHCVSQELLLVSNSMLISSTLNRSFGS